jgi:hypothetical protein
MAAKVVPSDVLRLIDKVFPCAESNNMGTSLIVSSRIVLIVVAFMFFSSVFK